MEFLGYGLHYLALAVWIAITVTLGFLVFKLFVRPERIQCCISDEYLPLRKTRPFRNLFVSNELFEEMNASDWVCVLTLRTSAEDPEKGVRLYDQKKKLWAEKRLPLLVETSYEEQDGEIITVLEAYARDKEATELRSLLSA